MKKRVISIFLMIIVMFAFAVMPACEERSYSIIGAWECHDESAPHDWMCSLIFSSDGRFVDRDGDFGDWQLVNRLLLFKWDEYPQFEVLVTVTPNTLTIQQGDDLNVRLTRVD